MSVDPEEFAGLFSGRRLPVSDRERRVTAGLDEALPRTLTVREAVNALRDGAAVYTSLPLEVGEEKLLVFLDAARLLARWERSDPEARLRLRMDAEGDLQVMAPLDGEA